MPAFCNHVGYVFLPSPVAQIIECRIFSIIVRMHYFLAYRTWADECGGDEPVYEMGFPIQGDSEISAFTPSRFQDARFAPTSERFSMPASLLPFKSSRPYAAKR
jgi:hypothetical protein